jgi:hypothetical protein
MLSLVFSFFFFFNSNIILLPFLSLLFFPFENFVQPISYKTICPHYSGLLGEWELCMSKYFLFIVAFLQKFWSILMLLLAVDFLSVS